MMIKMSLIIKIKILMSNIMKLIQSLMEEKSTNAQILKVIGKFLITLSDKLDTLNSNLVDIKEILKNNTSQVEVRYVDTPPDSIKKNIKKKKEDNKFIPTIQNDNKNEIKSKLIKTKVTKKDYSKQAKSLKDEK